MRISSQRFPISGCAAEARRARYRRRVARRGTRAPRHGARSSRGQRMPVEDIWFGYARLHLQSGDRDAARDACERANAVAPNALPPLRLLASLALDAGDPVAAQAWCRRALVHYARDPELLHLLGRALKAAGATAAAYRALTDCAAIAGNDARVLTTLGAVASTLASRTRRAGISSALLPSAAWTRARATTSASRVGRAETGMARSPRSSRQSPPMQRSPPRSRTSSTRGAICANGTGSTRSKRSSPPPSTRPTPIRAGRPTSRSPAR